MSKEELIEKYLEKLLNVVSEVIPGVEFNVGNKNEFKGWNFKHAPRGKSHHWISFGILFEEKGRHEFWLNIGALKAATDFGPTKDALIKIQKENDKYVTTEKGAQYFIRYASSISDWNEKEMTKSFSAYESILKATFSNLQGTEFLGVKKYNTVINENVTVTVPKSSQLACKNCNASIEEKDKFCGECGTPTHISCSNCSTKLNFEDKFCANCGTKVGSETNTTTSQKLEKEKKKNNSKKNLKEAEKELEVKKLETLNRYRQENAFDKAIAYYKEICSSFVFEENILNALDHYLWSLFLSPNKENNGKTYDLAIENNKKYNTTKWNLLLGHYCYATEWYDEALYYFKESDNKLYKKTEQKISEIKLKQSLLNKKKADEAVKKQEEERLAKEKAEADEKIKKLQFDLDENLDLLYELKEYDDVISEYEDNITLASEHSGCINTYLWSLYKADGQEEKALEQVKKQLKKYPDKKSWINLMGHLLYHLGWMKESAGNLEQLSEALRCYEQTQNKEGIQKTKSAIETVTEAQSMIEKNKQDHSNFKLKIRLIIYLHDKESMKLTAKELTNLLDEDNSALVKKMADELWVEKYLDRNGHKKYSIAERGSDFRLNLLSLSPSELFNFLSRTNFRKVCEKFDL